LPAIAAENARLRELQAAAVDRLQQADQAKVAELKAKIAGARAQLGTIQAKLAAAEAAARNRRVPYTGLTYDVSELDTAPKPTLRSPPDYPAALRQFRVSGRATIDFIVAPDGKVTNAQVTSASMPEFGQAALEGVERWQFEPGVVSGNAVATHMQIPIVFAMDDPGPPGGTSQAGKPKRWELTSWF
jgi:TonB family protein